MYVTDVGADRKQLWRPIWSSDCKCCTTLWLELCSIPTSITMPGNNGQHGAPIFKPLVSLARTAGRGKSLLWAGFPGYDARAVLPLGQARDPICVEAESSNDVTASATSLIHLMHHTQTHWYAIEGWFFVGDNAFVHPLPMEDVMPLFLLKASCGGVNKQQGGSSESYNTGRREGGKQSTIGSNFVRILFKILHQSFWWRGWWPPLSSYDLDETSHVTFTTLCSHCIVNLCVCDILFYLIRPKPEPTTARLPCPLLCIHPVF